MVDEMIATMTFAAALALSPKQAAAIDRIVARVMREERVPALSLGIARGRDTLYLRGYGMRDAARREPADPYTIYRIGSITKQFTAALALQAVERGEIRLSAPAPEGRTLAGLLAQIDGDRWHYDNANYRRAAEMLARAAGTSFSELLRTLIIEPLGLPSTSFGLPRATNVAGTLVAAPRDEPSRVGGAAAMSSNVPDLLRWLAALDAGEIVDPSDLRAMTTSRVLPDGAPTNYGYGFFITTWYGSPIAEHPGYLDGYSAIDALAPSDGLALAILSDADRVDLTPLAMSIFAIVEGEPAAPRIGALGRPPENENPVVDALLERAVGELARGAIDPALLTPEYARRLTAAMRAAFARRLAPLGPLRALEFLGRDGAAERYRLRFARAQLLARMTLRGGKIDDLVLEAVR